MKRLIYSIGLMISGGRRTGISGYFLKVTGTLVLIALAGCSKPGTSANVWTYQVPGGEVYASPDYTVSIEQNGKSFPSFVHYSYALDEYYRYHTWDKKLFQHNVTPPEKRTMASHSTAIFSFSGKITVRVTINPQAKHISLPLKSAKILPSSYNIPCTVENGNTIVFTMEKPEKIAVIANYNEVWQVFEEKGKAHVPIKNWNCNYREEIKRPDFHGHEIESSLAEGYKNPLFIMALPPETRVPEKDSPQTLVVNPGDSISQNQLDKYKTVWFSPGVHDLSKMGAYPWFQTMINAGQTYYVEGGAYVMARFKKNKESGDGSASILGRGIVSGINHEWIIGYLKDGSKEIDIKTIVRNVFGSYFDGGQIIEVDTIIGVSVTDRAFFGITGGRHIEDVAMLGAWHGNNDGPDFLDDCTITNCFLVAHDDNLKLNNNTHAKHIVIWQLENAHPIMVKEVRNNVTFYNSVAEDIDIIAYFTHKYGLGNNMWSQIAHSAIACITGGDISVNNLTFKDIRIESPFLYRVISFYSLDTSQPTAPRWLQVPTTDSLHLRINGARFENISVNCPVILHRSLLGSDYNDAVSNLKIINLNINGTRVTEENKDQFFEIEHEKVSNIAFKAE
jgi:hypothetical protein